MRRLLDISGGIDVHQSLMVASVARSNDGEVVFETREFGANVKDLAEMATWFQKKGVSKIAMESTGIYWICAYEALEEAMLEPTVVNAAQVKKVPGRKTDTLDSQWLAELLMYGLLRSSFIPSSELREARRLARHQIRISKKISITKNQLHKLLESRGVKLSTVCSRINGKSARQLIEALVDGRQLDEVKIRALVHGHMYKKIPQIHAAIQSRLSESDRWHLKQILKELDFYEAQFTAFSEKVDTILVGAISVRKNLETIPGIDAHASARIVSEIGENVTPFLSDKQLASWIGLAPGSNESAGKVKSSRVTKGNIYIRRTLIECAHAASRTPSQFKDYYEAIRARKGVKRAVVAVAHKLIRVIYSVLASGKCYIDPKVSYSYDFVKNNKSRWVRQLVKYGFARMNERTKTLEFI